MGTTSPLSTAAIERPDSIVKEPPIAPSQATPGSPAARSEEPRQRRSATRISRGLSKVVTACSLLLAIPLVLLARVMRPFLLIRFGPLPSQRIGPFAANVEVYVCEREAGLHGRRAIDLFYCAEPVCNRQLQTMWSRVIPIMKFARALEWVNRWVPGAAPHQIPMRRDGDRDLHGLVARTLPHLAFTAEELDRGWGLLGELGIEPGIPFVCFQARDAAYLHAMFPERDWTYHDYRNVDIRTMVPAIEALTRRGYLAVRMGAVVNEALPVVHPRIIDYSLKGRTEFLDIFLAAHCRFFLGDPSGIMALPMVFRRPWALVNEIPFEYLHTWGRHTLTIPKTLWLRQERRFMTFREILESGVGRRFHRSEQYEQAGIEVIENTPEDIAAVAVEMDERLKGTWRTTDEDDRLQCRFWALFTSSPLNGVLQARVGAEFLRQHRHLL